MVNFNCCSEVECYCEEVCEFGLCEVCQAGDECECGEECQEVSTMKKCKEVRKTGDITRCKEYWSKLAIIS